MRGVLVLAVILAASPAQTETADKTIVMTNEVIDLYVFEPICGYRIYKEGLDIYLLGTPMFWGEPVSQAEIEDARVREIALIGGDAYQRSRKCSRVAENFGPTGLRARGIAR